jgi:hypothetical protein
MIFPTCNNHVSFFGQKAGFIYQQAPTDGIKTADDTSQRRGETKKVPDITSRTFPSKFFIKTLSQTIRK